MKITKTTGVIAIAAVVTAVAVTVTIAITAHRQNSTPPTVWDKAASDYSDSYVPTEKDTIRTEIQKERSEKKAELYQQMTADGKDTQEAAFDADEQMLIEQVNEVGSILKKYNRLDKNFSFHSVDDNVKGMKAACDLLKSSEGLSAREAVVLEMYLEENYPVLRDLEGQQDLMKEIESVLN